MPRIPGADIGRLKQTISVARLAEGRGVELKRHGTELIGRCPFHDDKTPLASLSAQAPVMELCKAT